jgi:hypothetical protein
MVCKEEDPRPIYARIQPIPSHTRFLQINPIYKLKNNSLTLKGNQPGYDWAYKVDMIYKMPIHNTNWVKKEVGLNQCGDEMTWGFDGYMANLAAD